VFIRLSKLILNVNEIIKRLRRSDAKEIEKINHA
jgi:hypothetical protein